TVISPTNGDWDNPGTASHQTECRSLGLDGRLAPVTGGASGVGRSVCMVLAREGATVVVADRNRTGSNETIQMLQASYKGDHRAIYVDVSNPSAVSKLFEEMESSFPGRNISVVVNSAGIPGVLEEPCGSKPQGSSVLLARQVMEPYVGRTTVRRAAVSHETHGRHASYKGDHRAIYVDVSNPSAVSKLFEEMESSFPGRNISVVVNSAGIPGVLEEPCGSKPQGSSVLLARQVMEPYVGALRYVVLQFLTRHTVGMPKSSFMTGAAVDVTGGITSSASIP
ncbi:hypothetical protein HPB47_027683, partial [Ixodes persulcatus]